MLSIIKIMNPFFYKKSLIRHSKIRSIFTKYGIFKAKIYKDKQEENLVIMSKNFFDLKTPIVYIYSESHACEAVEHKICYCNKQIDIALKMLRTSGGAIIYCSHDVRSIDRLLQEINTSKLEDDSDDVTKTKVKLGLKAYRREHQMIGFIFKDLNLARIKLVTHHSTTIDIAEQLGIEIIKRAPAITVEYGN